MKTCFKIGVLAGLLSSMSTGMAFNGVHSDVTQPGDTIQIVNGVNDGDGNSGPSPGAETVEHAIDNVGQKYLNFLDLGSGFAVEPSVGITTLSGLRLYPANDAEPRDPASFLLEGSMGLLGPWTTIASGDLALPSTRNPGGMTPLSSLTSFQEVGFNNTSAYAAYRLTFPTLKDVQSANSMQIGEVEFLGIIGRVPPNGVPDAGSTLLLLGTALAGLGTFRRRLGR